MLYILMEVSNENHGETKEDKGMQGLRLPSHLCPRV